MITQRLVSVLHMLFRMPRAQVPATLQTDTPIPSHTVHLSSAFDVHTCSPKEVTYVEIEPHGAITLYRFTSGEESAYFELSRRELEVLFDACTQHQQLRATQDSHNDGLPVSLDDIPF
jgi:hypothetical protein